MRIDAGVEEGDTISPYYDPMIAKLIVWDETREKALARMRGALGEFRVVGVANNIGFLSRLVDSRSFTDADLDTGLIEREADSPFPRGSRTAGRCLPRRGAGPIAGRGKNRPQVPRPGSEATAGA